MNFKRLTAILLLLATVAAVGCTKKGDDSKNTGDDGTTGGGTVGTVDTQDMSIVDELPELDFNDEEFVISVEDYGGYTAMDFFTDDETDLDIVSEAIYKKNERVSDRLSIDLKYTYITHDWAGKTDYINNIISSVRSDDGAFDLIGGLGYFQPLLVSEGIYLDLSDMPYINTEKVWWSENFMEASTVDGKYYLVTGDASLGLLKNMFCMFMNLELKDDLDLEKDPYEMVRNKEWTLDNFNALIVGTNKDLNGNTEADVEDQYGLLVNNMNHITGYIEAFDVDIVEFVDGEATVVYGNEHNIEVANKLFESLFKNSDVYYDGNGQAELADKSIWKNGNILFTTGWLMHADGYRDLSFKYGVVPYPMWDENQEEYQTTTLTSYCVYGVPVSNKTPETATAVLEALAVESYNTVTPAYFEDALKVKYSDDEESKEMFDIIRAGVSFDFGYIFTYPLNSCSDWFRICIRQNEGNWLTTYVTKEDTLKTSLADLIETIRKNNQ